ncbi:MAG: hypothetical protein PHF00_01850 [Elusimicrobia bacterium]|nr:hypothetical protein [Elusimicrobiota bacterium]
MRWLLERSSGLGGLAAELGLVMAASYLLGLLFDLRPLSAGFLGIAAAFSALALLFCAGYLKLKSIQDK